MNSLIFLLARRYLIHSVHEKSVSTMVKICFLGIFLGSFSLAFITAITNGFEAEVYKKMQGIHSHASIRSADQLNVDAIMKVIHAEFPHVETVAPMMSTYVLLPAEQEGVPCVIVLRAIDPQAESQVSSLGQKIISKVPDSVPALVHVLDQRQILVGERFAHNYRTHPGAVVQLLYPDDVTDSSAGRITLLTSHATIGGIFKTGIDEFDANVVFCNFDFFNALFPDYGVTQLNIKFKPHCNQSATITALRNRLGLEVSSWQDLYPALVSALTLEKYVMFIIIALITLVASMNILSLLFMEIMNKRADIAILQVMGASPAIISSIFILMGLALAIAATTTGIGAAYGLSIIFERYPFIKLPDVYCVSHLPVLMDWQIGIAVFCVVITLSLVASWLPTRRIKTINIAQILRSEG